MVGRWPDEWNLAKIIQHFFNCIEMKVYLIININFNISALDSAVFSDNLHVVSCYFGKAVNSSRLFFFHQKILSTNVTFDMKNRNLNSSLKWRFFLRWVGVVLHWVGVKILQIGIILVWNNNFLISLLVLFDFLKFDLILLHTLGTIASGWILLL